MRFLNTFIVAGALVLAVVTSTASAQNQGRAGSPRKSDKKQTATQKLEQSARGFEPHELGSLRGSKGRRDARRRGKAGFPGSTGKVGAKRSAKPGKSDPRAVSMPTLQRQGRRVYPGPIWKKKGRKLRSGQNR